MLVGEKGLIGLLRYLIENEGFNSLLTEDLGEAVSLADSRQPHLIAMDDVAPHGAVLAARDRIYDNLRTRHIPVLILAGDFAGPEDLTARFSRVTGYVRKPFSPDVFVGELHGLLRQSSPATNVTVLKFADIVMELDAHRVYRNQRAVQLTPVEYRILQEFLKHPRRVLSRDEILATVREHPDHVASRSVDVHISRIRKALCEQREPNYIRTVRGVGYSLDADTRDYRNNFVAPKPIDRNGHG